MGKAPHPAPHVAQVRRWAAGLPAAAAAARPLLTAPHHAKTRLTFCRALTPDSMMIQPHTSSSQKSHAKAAEGVRAAMAAGLGCLGRADASLRGAPVLNECDCGCQEARQPASLASRLSLLDKNGDLAAAGSCPP